MRERRTKKLSLEEVQSRLAALSFSMVGEYQGKIKSQCVLRCAKGHEWDALIDNVIKANGTGCPHCAGKARLTVPEISRRLSLRGIKFKSTNTRGSTVGTFECEKGHTWKANLAYVLLRGGCPECRVNRPLTRAEVDERVSDRGYRLVGDYSSASKRAQFECRAGHVWGAIPDNVLRGKGCPECAEYGFNPKYPAVFYTLRIFSDDEEYVGFGITKDLQTRMSYHTRAIEKKGFNNEILAVYSFESGHDAKCLEDLVKSNFDVVDTGIKGFRKEAVRGDAYKDLLKLFEGLNVCV